MHLTCHTYPKRHDEHGELVAVRNQGGNNMVVLLRAVSMEALIEGFKVVFNGGVPVTRSDYDSVAMIEVLKPRCGG